MSVTTDDDLAEARGREPSPTDTTRTSDPSRRRPFSGVRRALRPTAAFWIMAGIGGLALWCLLFAIVLGPVQQHRSQRNLYALMRSRLASQTVPTGGEIGAGTPIALLDAIDIGMHDVVVVEGTGADQTQDGPGHRRDTPLPGQTGVSVLMGRSLLYGAPFEHITDLRPGAIVVITTGQGEFRYRVDGIRRPGDPGPLPLTAPNGRLTMITSEGIGSGLDASRQAVYVDATLLDTARPPSVGRPVALDSDETTMHGEPGSLHDLAICLAALVATFVVMQWLRDRWGRTQATVVCVPVVIALLWLSAEAASRLLPNLM